MRLGCAMLLEFCHLLELEHKRSGQSACIRVAELERYYQY